MEEVEEKVIEQGKPWTNAAYFINYEDAAKKKNDLLLETDDLHVKIKKLNSGNKNFVVKTRKSNKSEA